MDTVYFFLMPRPVKSIILPLGDAAKLQTIVTKGTHKSRKIARARALLAMSSGKGAAAVHAEVGISTTQYYRLKGRYLAEGLALEERPRNGQPPKVTPALEARITTLACSDVPTGTAR